MYRHATQIITLTLLLFAVTACTKKQAQSPSDPVVNHEDWTQQVDTIAWFSGSVDEAFTQAANTNKPIFLYWGAEWCPPCHELKATIFQRPEFIRQSRLFLPVYLDGDSERAQLYGEKFGVRGYPTVIIFSPAGEEITRIPGGMDIQQYVGVMNMALNALRPVTDLVASVRGGHSLADADWNMLASYSWGQDGGRVLGEASLFDTATLLATACPSTLPIEKSRLEMLALTAWLQDEDRDETLVPELSAALNSVLADEDLTAANINSFLYNSDAMIVLLGGEGEQRAQLAEQLQALALSVYENPATTVLERLDALFAWQDAQLALLDEGVQLPEGKQRWLYTETEKTRESLNSYQQHAAINTVSQMYYQAGLVPEARDALTYGMEVSKQPYYFMSSMGHMERLEGNDTVALRWYRKAWEASSGGATRVQWGTNYVLALLKLSPDDLAAIDEASNTVLSELAAQDSGLRHRSVMRMNRLSSDLLEWGADDGARQQVLARLRAQMEGICARVSGDLPETCDSFLQLPQAA